MTELRSKKEIQKMIDAGKIVSSCHQELRNIVKVGVLPAQINEFVQKYIEKYGATAEQIGYMGYPYATCVSVNDVVCHGFPIGPELKDGDIAKVDFVVNLDGWLADSAWAYGVGKLSKEAEKLMQVTKECLYLGIEKSIEGNRLGDVSNAIQVYAEKNKFSVVKDYTGHGIGQKMHDGFAVPHFGKAKRGPRLYNSMVFTIEPMINTGSWECKTDNDGWTARTLDGSLSCQYEHTIALTKEGPIIITEQD